MWEIASTDFRIDSDGRFFTFGLSTFRVSMTVWRVVSATDVCAPYFLSRLVHTRFIRYAVVSFGKIVVAIALTIDRKNSPNCCKTLGPLLAINNGALVE